MFFLKEINKNLPIFDILDKEKDLIFYSGREDIIFIIKELKIYIFSITNNFLLPKILEIDRDLLKDENGNKIDRNLIMLNYCSNLNMILIMQKNILWKININEQKNSFVKCSGIFNFNNGDIFCSEFFYGCFTFNYFITTEKGMIFINFIKKKNRIKIYNQKLWKIKKIINFQFENNLEIFGLNFKKTPQEFSFYKLNDNFFDYQNILLKVKSNTIVK